MGSSRSLDKEKVARCFRRARTSYDEHGVVQKRVGDELVELLADFPQIRFDRVLEVGCCTGMMTRTLCERFAVERLYLNDLVPDFEQTVIDRLPPGLGTTIQPFFGDIESLQLPQELDLVVSSSTLQWLEDLPAFFHRVARALGESGHLAFSLFSAGTLKEFKQLTGIGLDYMQTDELVHILETDFELKWIKSREKTQDFPTTYDLLRHFKATGVGGVSEHRWTTGSLKELERNYKQHYGTSRGLPVSYATTSVIARKKGTSS